MFYLGDGTSADDLEIQSAFNAELASQRRVCNIPAVRTVTATTTNGSAVVTAAVDTFGSGDVNAAVSGTGIPADTTVVSVDSATQVTLSAAATADGTDATLTLDPDRTDLNEALFRRVAHNLALRTLPLGVQASLAEGAVATTRVGGTDAEVRRLEAPFRRRTVG